MTIHLAYPNVLPREDRFIGCGRYAIMEPGVKPNSSYQEIEDTPNTPNRLHLEHVMQLLGPEAYDTSRTVFEKKDRPDRQYLGDSLDMAFLLAHIHRAGNFRITVNGDLWCTGVVQMNDDRPILRKVDATGFRLKLKYFLAKENPDPLFIVPVANLNNEILRLITSSGGQLFSLKQFNSHKFKRSQAEKAKVVLKVLPHELTRLVQTLFRVPKKKSSLKWVIVFAMLILSIAGGWFYTQNNKIIPPTPQQIYQSLEAGQFKTAANLLKKADPKDSRIKEISELSHTPLNVALGFIYRRSPKEELQKVVVENGVLPDVTLSHKDYYSIEIQPQDFPKPLYLYVFQSDTLGNLDRVFPNPLSGDQNPVPVKSRPLRIPASQDEWLYLSKLDESDKEVVKETLVFLLAPWKAQSIETLYEKIHAATDDSQRRQLADKFLSHIRQYAQDKLPSVFYRECQFRHSS